jgi:Tol biopolymer transport system component
MTTAVRPWVLALAAALAASGTLAQSGHDLFQQALVKERAEGRLQEAIDLYDRIARTFPGDHALAAKALVQMGQCYEKLGKAEARKAYERVIRDYADQAEPLQVARTRLAALAKPPRHEMAVRRIWSDPMVDNGGEISPDGRYLSFVDWTTGDLAVRDLTTGQNRRLTNKGSWEESQEYAVYSCWSPDGREIAYDWWSLAHHNELRVVEMENARSRTLFKTADESFLETLDWSPDGREILVGLSSTTDPQVGPMTNRLAAVAVADGTLRIIRAWDGLLPYDTGLSPDGRFILSSLPAGKRGSPRDVYALSWDGKDRTTLVDHPANDVAAGWSPDGRWVLFVSDRTGTPDLWMLPVQDGRPGGEAQLVKSGIGRMMGLGFDATGRYYYGTAPQSQDIFVIALDPATGRVASPPSRLVRRFEGQNDWPSYSRDGRSITYVSGRGSGVSTRFNVLCIRSLETGEEREYTTDFRRIVDPRFSADGKAVFVVAWPEGGRFGLYRFDAATGERSLVMQVGEGSSIEDYEVSPDGKAIFYPCCEQAAKVCRLLKRDLASGEDTEVYRGPYEESFTIDLTPDGRTLALLCRQREDVNAERVIRVVAAAGGAPREVYHGHLVRGSNAPINAFEFTADGRSLLVPRKTTPSDEPGWTLLSIPIDGGTPQDLGLKMLRFSNLSARPDGREIVFGSRGTEERNAEIWVIEDFLPATKAQADATRR